jgi:hypothetical protein
VARAPRGLRRPGTRRRSTDGPAPFDDEGVRALGGTRDRTLRRSQPRRGFRRSPIFRSLRRRGRSARFTPRKVVTRSFAQVGLWRQLKSSLEPLPRLACRGVHLPLQGNHARLHGSPRSGCFSWRASRGQGVPGQRSPTIVGAVPGGLVGAHPLAARPSRCGPTRSPAREEPAITWFRCAASSPRTAIAATIGPSSCSAVRAGSRRTVHPPRYTPVTRP